MAETPLTDSIEALTTYANQTTGASDTNLSDAVYTLARGYGGGGQEVPAEYDELLGIYFTSTNLINTGYTWNADTEIKLVAERGPGMHSFANIVQATNFYIGYGSVNSIYYKIGSEAEKPLPVQSYPVLLTATINGLSADYFDSGNTQGSVAISGTTVTTTGEVVIGGIDSRPWRGTLYLFEVSENNVKIVRMIPAKRKSDNVVGLYDVIRHAFYTDSTGNGFTALTYGDMHLS